MTSAIVRLLCVLFGLLGAVGASGQSPINGTAGLPLRFEVPGNCSVYIQGVKYSYLEFTFDQARDAVNINGALFHRGLRYVPPDEEIRAVFGAAPFFLRTVGVDKMSWSDAYREYQEKYRVFREEMNSAVKALRSNEITDESFTRRLNEFLNSNHYDSLIDTVIVRNGTISYRCAGEDVEIGYGDVNLEAQIPMAAWDAEAGIHEFIDRLFDRQGVTHMFIYDDGLFINIDDQNADRAEQQIYESVTNGNPVRGPLPTDVVMKIIEQNEKGVR